ncbi:3-isopropylmalate dehydratase small subunit [Trinickia mobilis]|uniref:3-isopropylmalate dehydratase small subunit n=1 Tax=Trinickia mobilis TaxID=2816356 RepID=UPI001A8C4032|nr:3-isopropylmalate dehydratase small subunit [Trinickia mobilis]
MPNLHCSVLGLPLRKSNVDTDQIIPARFCYKPTRSGHGQSLFGDWRQDEKFVLNDVRYQGAKAIVAGREFGTGSSREYAVWAIKDAGFDYVISANFGDIFYRNSILNGLLPVRIEESGIYRLWELLEKDPAMSLEIDLCSKKLSAAGLVSDILISDRDVDRYMSEMSEIEETLLLIADIEEFEAKNF